VSKITIYPRIISAELGIEPNEPGRTSRPGFNYATLLKRGRRASLSRNPPSTAMLSPSLPKTHENHQLNKPSLLYESDENDVEAQLAAEEFPQSTEDSTLTPYLQLLAQQQFRVAQLIQFLATRVADFCCDEAICAHGNWTIRIPIAPTLLRSCVLYLSLSHFELTLRFETPDDTTRHLILSHSKILQNHLDQLLEQHDAPRDVEITVG